MIENKPYRVQSTESPDQYFETFENALIWFKDNCTKYPCFGWITNVDASDGYWDGLTQDEFEALEEMAP